MARRALVQLSYAIGVAEPLSIYVDTYGTGKKTDEELVAIIRKNWDLRPGVIGLYLGRRILEQALTVQTHSA
jgi:S-adenosylmethionine synthetase